MNYFMLDKSNPEHYKMLENLMFEYVAETDLHQGISTPKNIIPRITKSMIDKIDENRLLQMVLDENEIVGFCYAKIDKENDKGIVRVNWGYIMEFFVRPIYRRKGIGKKLVDLCEDFFANNGVKNVWLTADSVTGYPFWIACNYLDSNEILVENNQKIFTKELNK